MDRAAIAPSYARRNSHHSLGERHNRRRAETRGWSARRSPSRPSAIAVEERILDRLSQDHVAEALAAVPHDFRDVLVLVDIGEFSYAEAAQILDIPIGTVMSRLHRGRRILKQQLADLAVEAK